MTRTSPRGWLVAGTLALLVAVAAAADRSPAAMADAANAFLKGLSPEQRSQAAFAFDSDERLKFHFIPTEMFARKGLTIQAMNQAQRKLAHDLLRSALSDRGYKTAAAIMDLETILGAIERTTGGKLIRDPERYYFSVFGTPSANGAWGWRAEGHHVSLNVTVVNGRFVATSPMFFGSNPAEVPDGEKKGLRILGSEEDAARTLLTALDAGQRAKAVISPTAPNDIATMNSLDIQPLSPAGIVAADLNPSQRGLLQRLIDVYVSSMAADLAADRQARIKGAGFDKIAFAWAGEAERGKRHYYRVQGPTFLIEFDNTQNNANHVHSVWRDFQGDFGRDLLREHLKSSH
jgi:hypothetical protein